MRKLLLLFVFLCPTLAMAQLLPGELQAIEQVDFEGLQTITGKRVEDYSHLPHLIAINHPVQRHLEKAGTWMLAENQRDSLLVFKMRSDRNYGSSLTFENVRLASGDALYIMGQRGELHALEGVRNGKPYVTNFVAGGEVSLVCYHKAGNARPELQLSSFDYAVDELRYLMGVASSDFCEIDVNCGDGANWQDQKRSVVRLLTKGLTGGGSKATFRCTGTLLNNTAQDDAPYILTADHCATQLVGGGYADLPEELYDEWVFFFNFEYAQCEVPDDVTGERMQGCDRIAWSGTTGDEDPDFHLVRLDEDIPEDFNVYFAGWSRFAQAPQRGVTIHHPAADVKKISTFSEAAESSEYLDRVKTDTHWAVVWTSGTTEGGSSGCGLFNENGLLVGNLTGGQSSCTNIQATDLFGKMSESWSWGEVPTKQLGPWLDPTNSGVFTLEGRNFGDLSVPEPEVVPHRIALSGANQPPFFIIEGVNPQNIEWLTIVNTMGVEMKKYLQPNMTQFPLTELTTGVYVISYGYEGKDYRSKIILTR